MDKNHSESCQKSITIAVHKKGNNEDCENCTGINLLNSGYKMYTNIIKNKLYTSTKINYVKNGKDSKKDYLVVMAILH
jgi:hypothetical protein